jgi:predicted membrane-bound spermidine synthase
LKPTIFFFLLLSFIEGASVMAAELLGAKMLAPFFGSSLYVWSSVMAITLGGLAAGYFAGGVLSTRPTQERNLYIIMILAAAFTMVMPFTSRLAFILFGQISLIPAVIISSMIILFPPVFMMGMVSPMIISNLATEKSNAGKTAGTVYAISTVGGILATFLFGFWIIPAFGLSKPALVTGCILGLFPFVQLLIRNKNNFSLVFLFALAFGIITQKNKAELPYLKILYTSEGLLGQIMVVDYPSDIYTGDTTKKGQTSRWLFVNRVSQTMDDPSAIREKGEERYFTYVYRLEEALDTFPQDRRKVLLLGLGGGSVAKHLTEKGFEVESCELDGRIAYVAKEYFGLPSSVKITIDDARHFIRTCKSKYDVIIFDTFKGEEAPSHVFTVESLKEIKTLLEPGGLVFANSFGFIEGEKGLGLRSIYQTLMAAGFNTSLWPTSEDENHRNILFVASAERKPVHKDFVKINDYDFSDGVVMSDEYPRFEILNAAAALAWRKMSIETFYEDRLQRMVPIFE